MVPKPLPPFLTSENAFYPSDLLGKVLGWVILISCTDETTLQHVDPELGFWSNYFSQ